MWNPLYDRITAASESGNRDFDRYGRPIRSPAGAMYRMQTMPATARDPGFGVRPAADSSPEEYNRVGRDYRDAMFRRYDDPAKGWGAYNWGPGNVDNAVKSYGDQWLAHAPAETRSYVQKNVGQLGGQMPLPAPRQTTLGEILGKDDPYGIPSLNSGTQPGILPSLTDGMTLADVTQHPNLPKAGKGGVLGSGLSLGEILTYGINGYLAGRGNPAGQQNLNMIAQAQNMEQDRNQFAERLAAQAQMKREERLAKAAEPPKQTQTDRYLAEIMDPNTPAERKQLLKSYLFRPLIGNATASDGSAYQNYYDPTQLNGGGEDDWYYN